MGAECNWEEGKDSQIQNSKIPLKKSPLPKFIFTKFISQKRIFVDNLRNFPFCYCSLESISETKLKGFTVPTEEEFKKAKNAHFKNAPARLAKQQAAN